MADFGSQQLGRWLIMAGMIIMLAGVAIVLLAKFDLLRLPGDIEVGGKNWRIYMPITTCIVISLVLTLIFWLINYFRR